jgi:hypothetical protein
MIFGAINLEIQFLEAFFQIFWKSISLKPKIKTGFKRYVHTAVSPPTPSERQTDGSHGSADPTGQPKPSRGRR